MSEKPPSSDPGGPPRTGASPGSIPTRIGRYPIIERIGQSGMSVVYRGLDPVLDREVAIKVLIGIVGDDLDPLRPRFYREARAVARLQHRNIVTIFEFAEEEGTPYIVMEFLPGESLSARGKAEPPLPMDQKVDIVAQLSTGLCYAHKQGIVHGDVKPANIFLLPNGSVKLLDFGIAKLASSTLTRQPAVLGNPLYMSPEQIRGDAVDGRSDVFSAGAVLFELLAGRRPFDGDSMSTVVMKILTSEAQSLDATIPARLADVVSRALQKQPAQRFQTACEFARALRALEEGVRFGRVLPRSSPSDLETVVAGPRPASARTAAGGGPFSRFRLRLPQRWKISIARPRPLAWLKRQLTFQRRKTSAQLPTNTVVDDVHFTLTSPARLRRETSTEVIFWCHVDRERISVIRRAIHALRVRKEDLATKSEGPFEVARGTVLTVALAVDGLVVEPPTKTVLWKGRTGNATFVVITPADCMLNEHRGHASVRIHGTEIARLDFVLTIGQGRSIKRAEHRAVKRHKKAFASYASEDRDEVLKRVQGIKKAVPTLDIFVDILTLRSGQYWEKELRQRIPASDIFYLFWSRRAKQSEWVDREWRLAYDHKGLDFIDPVPLEPEALAPPPPELAAKHFDDFLLPFINRGKSPES